MAIYHIAPDPERNSEIETYLAILNETLDKVFHAPAAQRTKIVASLKKESGKYWDVTLHYLPLYSAADLMGIEVLYPDFDKFEDRYARLVEGKKRQIAADGLGGGD